MSGIPIKGDQDTGIHIEENHLEEETMAICKPRKKAPEETNAVANLILDF